jgi:hypothetical protein
VSLFIAFLLAGFWLGKAAGHAGFKKINRLLSASTEHKKANAGESVLHSLDGSGAGSGTLYPLPAYVTESEERSLPAALAYPLPPEPEIRQEASAQVPQAYPLPEEELSSGLRAESSSNMLKPNNGQRNLLVIGVNQIGSPILILEGIWLVLYRQDTPRFTLMPVYPGSGMSTNPQAAEALTGLFSLDSYGNPGASFLAALHTRKLWWNNYVVVDQTAMAGLIDFVGGVTLGNTMMDGIHAIANMPSVQFAPHDALLAQAEVIKDICSRSTQPELSARVEALLRLVPYHLNTDMDLEQALTQWERLRSTGPFTCEFPSLWPIH